jgi:hypothetical protein
MTGSYEYGDEPSSSGVMELVMILPMFIAQLAEFENI